MSLAANIAIGVAATVNIYLMLLVVDANYGYTLGFEVISPPLRLATTVCLAGCALWACWSRKTIRWDWLLVAFALYGVNGIVIGVVRYGFTYELVRHAFAAATMFASYAAGAALSEQITKASPVLTRWAWATLVVSLLVMIASIPAMIYSGYSLSPASLLLALDAGLNGHPWLSALSAPVFLFGNRRAVLLAIGAMVATVIVARHLKERTILVRSIAGAVAAAAVVVMLSIGMSGAGKLISTAGMEVATFERSDRMMALFKGLSGSKDGVAVAAADEQMGAGDSFVSGRISQAKGVLDAVDDSWVTLALGAGFGSFYDWTYWSNNLNAMQHYRFSQADTAPVYLLLTGGILFSALLTFFIGLRVFQIFSFTSSGGRAVGALFVIGFAIDMFFSLQPNAPLFWLLLGAFGFQARNIRA